MSSKIQAVLFDCDGVIADSEHSWNEIDREHLSAFGVPDYRGEHKAQVIGKSFALAGGFYRDLFAIQAPLEEMMEQRTGVAAKFYAESIPLFDGVPDVLAQLRARGLKIALATSSVARLIDPFLERHNLKDSFDFIVTGEQVEHGKPHPDIYLKAAAGVGVLPQHCLVVEDALAGLQSGRSAGCSTVAIPDARWLDPALFEGKADFQISNLRALGPLLDRIEARS